MKPTMTSPSTTNPIADGMTKKAICWGPYCRRRRRSAAICSAEPSALDIAGAVESLADADAVVVLMDLGSAVLSAGAALEQVEPALRERVRLADAPFVEGAVAAGVEASLGSNLDAVVEAAQAACRHSKLG